MLILFFFPVNNVNSIWHEPHILKDTWLVYKGEKIIYHILFLKEGRQVSILIFLNKQKLSQSLHLHPLENNPGA
jgi:hypothetical protein